MSGHLIPKGKYKSSLPTESEKPKVTVATINEIAAQESQKIFDLNKEYHIDKIPKGKGKKYKK